MGRERLARALRAGHEAVNETLVAGRVLTDQAEAICTAVDGLPRRAG